MESHQTVKSRVTRYTEIFNDFQKQRKSSYGILERVIYTDGAQTLCDNLRRQIAEALPVAQVDSVLINGECVVYVDRN